MKVKEIISESNEVHGRDWSAKLPEGKDPVKIMKNHSIGELVNQLFMADPVLRKVYAGGIAASNKKNKLSTLLHYYTDDLPSKAEFNSFKKKVEKALEGTGFAIDYFGLSKDGVDPKNTNADMQTDYELIVKKV